MRAPPGVLVRSKYSRRFALSYLQSIGPVFYAAFLRNGDKRIMKVG
jgi:hypothetical protein